MDAVGSNTLDKRTGDEDDPTRPVGNLVGTELSAWREALDENGPYTASAIRLHDQAA